MNTFVILIVSVLLAATLKDDSAGIANSDYWYTLSVHPLISIAKTYSSLLIVPAIASFFYTFSKSPVISTNLGSALAFFLSAVLVSTLRATLELGAPGFSMGIPLILIFIIFIPMASRFYSFGEQKTFDDIRNSLAIFSVIMIFANFLTYITGYGFASGVPRLFGTSSHPNFLGVLMALCLIVVSDYFKKKISILNLAMLIIFAMGVTVLYRSGSRTGMIMLLTGSSLLYWAKTNFSLKRAVAILCIGAVIGAVFVVLVSGDVTDTPFDRGDGSAASNTRAEAWATMIDLLNDEPLLGYGYPVGPSENSIMRGWVAYGILYALFMILSILFLIINFLRKYNTNIGGALFLGVSVALAIGAMLEGYLVDRFSGPVMLYIILCCAAAFAPDSIARPNSEQRVMHTNQRPAHQRLER